MEKWRAGLPAVRWIALPSVTDPRGVLTSIESGMDIPFEIKRIFMMHHVTAARGGHAHLDTDQVIIAAAGCFTLELSNGTCTRRFDLNDPAWGVYTPRMIFTQLHDFSPDAVCLVLANSHYDMSRSIRSWDDYLTRIKS
jgi:hypothetical protein